MAYKRVAKKKKIDTRKNPVKKVDTSMGKHYLKTKQVVYLKQDGSPL